MFSFPEWRNWEQLDVRLSNDGSCMVFYSSVHNTYLNLCNGIVTLQSNMDGYSNFLLKEEEGGVYSLFSPQSGQYLGFNGKFKGFDDFSPFCRVTFGEIGGSRFEDSVIHAPNCSGLSALSSSWEPQTANEGSETYILRKCFGLSNICQIINEDLGTSLEQKDCLFTCNDEGDRMVVRSHNDLHSPFCIGDGSKLFLDVDVQSQIPSQNSQDPREMKLDSSTKQKIQELKN